MPDSPDPAAVQAARNLTITLAQAILDPTVPVETLEAAAWNAHHHIEATGGDYLGVYCEAHHRH
ncbi:hypothetical protein WKI65_42945 [Streptomyces sp. MS1.AVA.3]|uniref:hypothetical protein n=1 Tax=Streptomyces decoyicus TaxID=249567 RepID=UPI0030C1D200